jgi:hypothetical protein
VSVRRAALKRSVVAVAVGLLAIVPVFVPVVSATAEEPPRIEMTSEDRLWWSNVGLDWDVVNASGARCSIDAQSPFECRPFDANQKLSVAHEGVHQLTITPVDGGEPVGEPLTVDVGVDRTAPTVSLWRSDTRSRVRVGDPMTVDASYEDAMSGIDEVTCTLVPLDIYADGPVSCTEAVTSGVLNLSNPEEDGYELFAWAVDRAGNETTSERMRWLVDGNAPDAALDRAFRRLMLRPKTPALYFEGWEYGPNATTDSAFTMRSRLGVRRPGTDPVRWRYPASWEASGVGQIPRFSRRVAKMVPGTTYCVETEAVDEVGNRQPWKHRRCFVRALDDKALATSRGWRTASPRGAYKSTAITTRVKGARAFVRREGVYALDLRALRCPRCGAVVVKAGNREIGRWNLRSHPRGWAQKRFGIGKRFSGRITVRSLNSRKVVLDAFGLKAVRGG